ncbi:MAG: hypothetical protein KME27_18155 [Lyngbya sp. HA4199-MV5]|jgi:hypothetical protein|nr:hypothetical protein [Lyngbya sp. HA4199-MV5]
MNAAEQATSLETTSKIAAAANLFKAEFPDAKSDLKPWVSDPDTQELVDPESIDIGFHFPGFSRLLQSRSLLLQIRFYQDLQTGERRAIGAEIAGFDHRGKQWWLSTVDHWAFEGANYPTPEMGEKLKAFLRSVLELFGS